MKRVLVFAAYFYPHVGGYEKNIQELLKRLIQRGYGIDVVTCNTNRALTEEELDGIHIHRLPSWNILGGTYPIPKPTPTTLRTLSRLFQKRFELINTQTRFFSTSLLGLIFAKIKRAPLVHTERGTRHSVSANRMVETIGKTYDHIVGSLIVKSAWRNIGVSQAACNFAKHLGARHPIVIPNGIDTDIFKKMETNLRDSLGLGDVIVVTFVGRLIYAKGVHNLISAFPKTKELIPQAKLLIVGDGPYRADLDRLAHQVGCKGDIIFLGEKKQNEVIRILSATDIFVNPSYSEGLPTSVMEAASIGLPVIATDVGGTNEIITNSKTGILVKAGNTRQLEKSLHELLASAELRRELGENARMFVRQKFDWDRITQDWIKVVERVG